MKILSARRFFQTTGVRSKSPIRAFEKRTPLVKLSRLNFTQKALEVLDKPGEVLEGVEVVEADNVVVEAFEANGVVVEAVEAKNVVVVVMEADYVVVEVVLAAGDDVEAPGKRLVIFFEVNIDQFNENLNNIEKKKITLAGDAFFGVEVVFANVGKLFLKLKNYLLIFFYFSSRSYLKKVKKYNKTKFHGY
jgi:hypothetical protein